MAQPEIPLEIWAEDDVTLPNTGQLNKDRPIDDLWSKGYDRGQKPANEEYNYVLNMLCQWTSWVSGSDGLGAYLPKQGTKITFQGKAVGEVNFNGDIETTINLNIADLNNATDVATPNTIAKRDSNSALSVGDLFVEATSETDNATAFFRTSSGRIIGYVDGDTEDNSISLIRQDGNSIKIGDTGTLISNPRSNSLQGQELNSLTRKDYVDQQVAGVMDTAGVGWLKNGATGYIVQSFISGDSGGQTVRTKNFPIPFTTRVDSVVATWMNASGQPDYPVRITDISNSSVSYIADGAGTVSFVAIGV